MSDAKIEAEMDAPATKRDVHEIVRGELQGAEERLRGEIRDGIHQMRSLIEELWSNVKALLEPLDDLPSRMTDAEARLDALEQPPPPRRSRRRSNG